MAENKTKIDIFSGFLGAGKTTPYQEAKFIKPLARLFRGREKSS